MESLALSWYFLQKFIYNQAKLGYCNILGVDYSLQAVQLAQKIAEKEGVQVNFEVDDVLNSQLKRRFQVCILKLV